MAAACFGALAWAVTESLATGPVTVASDSFNRTVSGGWGAADVGGSWTVLDTAANWSVTPGIGSISVPASAQQRAVLGGVSVQNVSLLAKITNGSDETLAVYKPQRGERPLWDFPDGTLCAREYAAWIVGCSTRRIRSLRRIL